MAASRVIVIDTTRSGPFWDNIREWARGSDSALRTLVTFKVCGRGWLASELGVPQGLGMRPRREHMLSPAPQKHWRCSCCLCAPMLVCARPSLPPIDFGRSTLHCFVRVHLACCRPHLFFCCYRDGCVLIIIHDQLVGITTLPALVSLLLKFQAVRHFLSPSLSPVLGNIELEVSTY